MLVLTKENSSPGPLSDARVMRAQGELEKTLVAMAKALAPDSHSAEFDPAKISKHHLVGKVALLRKTGKLGLDIGVVKIKTGGYALARYPEPRLSPQAKWGRKRAS